MAGSSVQPVPVADVTKMPASRFPDAQRARLSNGLDVVVVERHELPIVNLALVLDVGSASDPVGQIGLAQVEAAALLDGTASLDALAFEDRKLSLGVEMTADVGLDTTQIAMSALAPRLDGALDLLADVLLRPALRSSDIEREKALLVARITQQKDDPIGATIRVANPLVYGRDHPYGRLTTESGVASLTADQVQRHHGLWFQPTGATIVVVGDMTLKSLLPKLEARFGGWHAKAGSPAKAIPEVAAPSAPTVYLIDKPGAQQSIVAAFGLAPPRSDPDDLGVQTAMTTLGGAFSSRLNLNLREDKHWAYGAFAGVVSARRSGLFYAAAPVQTDKTAESFAELRRELTEIIGSRPIDARELDLARHTLTLSLPGRWETGAAIAGSLAESATYGLPDDYWSSYAGNVERSASGHAARSGTGGASRNSDMGGDRRPLESPSSSRSARTEDQNYRC